MVGLVVPICLRAFKLKLNKHTKNLLARFGPLPKLRNCP